ncbi:glyoxalase domain protein [Natronomonas moolapensis 8.8.11]|uniref:Glyoxalase domain protein n=1 Tax=Natronomonas moolapensis (strain DSM 18674 / CECT 7526 / JCM 14361 / 8.8.11) TaxID=268739 RepID=M1XPH8_NATM8|nr:VOC family protein [Natronomonas moolapensis]CCQ35962.1 glyoxalase domain protein [Natronomonas moolapensis 8.8.11]
MSDPQRSPPNGLEAHHTGLTVADLDRSVEFYAGVLGCTVESRFSVSGDAFETVVGRDGVSGRFVHLNSGDSRIELVEYEPAGPPREPTTLPQPGGSHLAFSVDDVDALFEGLPDRIDPLSEPQTTDSGTRLVFVRDPDGNLIELLEA